MPKKPIRVVVAYVPVIHRGYLEFFKNNKLGAKLYVLDNDIIEHIDYLRKDLRAIKPREAVKFINATKLFESVELLNFKKLVQIDQPGIQIIMPDEDISRAVGGQLKHAKALYKPVFLRWDRRALEENAKPLASEKIATDKSYTSNMRRAFNEAAKSSDIWRRVGAVLFDKSGRLIGEASNQGQPSAHTPWIEGDPRNIFNKGVGIEMSLFIHAEAALIAKAAKNGTKLEGATMYATTFPCPACAKLIAHSGICNLFYSEGYGILDGQRVLEEFGVRLQRVLQKPNLNHPEAWVPYKKT